MMPEHESIEVFVQYCFDDEIDFFTTRDMLALNAATHTRLQDIRKELEGYGLRFVPRVPERHVRGFQTSSNDRYWGPGSEKMCGGSGWEQIDGFAGNKNSW